MKSPCTPLDPVTVWMHHGLVRDSKHLSQGDLGCKAAHESLVDRLQYPPAIIRFTPPNTRCTYYVIEKIRHSMAGSISISTTTTSTQTAPLIPRQTTDGSCQVGQQARPTPIVPQSSVLLTVHSMPPVTYTHTHCSTTTTTPQGWRGCIKTVCS